MARLLQRLASGREDGACELFGREDMGSMLGITTETASRIVAEFKRSGKFPAAFRSNAIPPHSTRLPPIENYQ